MKLDKAIRNNEEILNRGSMIDDPDDSASIKLGNEALKRLKDIRNDVRFPVIILLPGETED